MKTLLLARHAKSSWDVSGQSDFHRGLNKRGEKDAPMMALYLKQCGYVIHRIVTSDAVRALATATEYKKLLTPENELVSNSDLYLASRLDIVHAIKQLPDEAATVMLVGHNPGMTETLNYLTQERIDNMPTCSVAIIQFEISGWKDIAKGGGDLLGFDYPKKHL